MTLKISSVKDGGIIGRERIVMRSNEDCNPGKYLLLCTFGDANGRPLSQETIQSFWFPDFEMKSNDLLVVYTKIGSPTTKVNESKGRTTYFYYWQQEEPIWAVGTVAALLEVLQFSHLAIEPLTDEDEEM